VALGANLASAVYFAFGFLRMGTTALTAQALGSGDGREIRATAWRAFIIAAVIGLLAVLAIPLALGAGSLLFAPEPAIDAELRGYLQVRLLGAPLALANAVVLGWLLGMQDSRGPLVLLIVTNLVNAGLDMLFVWGLGFTASGVALATVMAEGFGLVLGIWLLRRHLLRLGSAALPSRAQVLAATPFKRLFQLNLDLFLRTIVLQAAFVSFMALASRQGPVILAANAILMHFFMLGSYCLDGFAFAAEAMVGRAVGARDPRALRDAARAGFVNAGLLALLVGALFWLVAPWIVGLLTAIEPVRDAALDYRVVVALIPLIAVWAFLFDGIFIGATRTAELRNAMVASLAVYGLAAAALVPWLGNPGLWTAMLIFLAARGVFLALVYRRAGFGAAFVGGAAPG
jgi:MATE family multidrug resistance protein